MKIFKEFYRFILHIIENRRLISTLVKNDFKKQYLGSYLGLIWVFIQPIIFMAAIWFVFEVGFRGNQPMKETPFFLWLMSGMVPWMFFSNAVSGGTEAIVHNAYLVKKVAFRVSILPLVNIGSALIIHFIFIFILIILFLLQGIQPTIYWIQLFFFAICNIFLLTGISWLTSAIRVFIKDITTFVGIILQLGFWFTPIFWSPEMFPPKFQYLLQFNPLFFIVNGYRSSLIDNKWFWETPEPFIYFLMIAFSLFIAGAITFKRLRPHFADVL